VKKKSTSSSPSNPEDDREGGTSGGVGDRAGDVSCEGAAGTAAASPLLSLPLCQDGRVKEGLFAPCSSLSPESERHCDAGNAASGDRGGAAFCKGAAGTAAASSLFSLPFHQDGREKRRQCAAPGPLSYMRESITLTLALATQLQGAGREPLYPARAAQEGQEEQRIISLIPSATRI
jgi:hypothetical protein